MSGFTRNLGTSSASTPSGSGFTRGLNPGGTTRRRKKKQDEGRPDSLDFHFPVHSGHQALEDLRIMASPLGFLAGKSKNKKLRAAGNVLSAVGSSPIDVVTHPGASVSNLKGMAVGLFESPYAITKSIQKHGLHKTMSMLWHSTVEDYKARYGDDWQRHAKQNPLFNLADALMVLGPGLKGASISKAVSDLARMDKLGETGLAARAARGPLVKGGKETSWANLTPREKLRIARAESRAPGTMTRGQRDTRNLRLQIGPPSEIHPEGVWIESNQALASGPLRRGVQQSLDALAQEFPDLPGAGARSRITRANARQIQRVMDRELGSVVDVGALKGLPKDALTRLYWESQLVKHGVDEAGNLTFDHADVSKQLKDLRDALHREHNDHVPKITDDPQLSQWLQAAKQQGFGAPLLKRLDAAIKYQPDARYERAIGAMRQATKVAEATIHDTSGFTTLKNQQRKLWNQLQVLGQRDEAGNPVLRPSASGEGHVSPIAPEHAERAQAIMDELHDVTQKLARKQASLDSMLHNRRGLVRDWLDNNTPVPAPERDAWAKAMRGLGWDERQTADALVASDRMARALRPDDPAAFYRDRVGMPTGMTPAQVKARANGALWQDFPESGRTPLIEGDVMAPAETSAYYSRLQKQVSDAWGTKQYRQSGQVEKQLRDKVSQQEFYNAGLDNFFNQFGKNEMISQAQLQEHLANPLNAYNLVEHHRVNDFLADEGGMGTFYGGGPQGWGDSLLSRSPDMGEYHEITFSLPREGRDVGYEGAGMTHWNRTNVVGHVRFQVFEEGGKKKLLIEEIQSDWASDYRKAVKQGREWRAPTEEQKAEFARLQGEYEDAKAKARVIEDRYEEARQRRNEAASELASNTPERQRMDAELRSIYHELSAAEDVADEAASRMWAAEPGGGGTPPPALSSQQVTRLATNRVLRHAAENGVDQVIVVDRHVQHIRNSVGGPMYHQDWQHFASSMPTKEARAAAFDLLDEETPYARMYEKDIPKQIKALIEREGKMVDNAYQGHFATQHGDKSPVPGDMAGTVFDLDKAAREKALSPTHLYQTQPEWGRLPRGANEMLAKKGQRVIHLFQNADVSTWLHELSHSAVYDLAAEDQAILDRFYGAGKKGIHNWDRAAHENYARDFERFVRTGGLSVSRAVAQVFERIQEWMQRTYRAAKAANPDEEIPADVERVFQKMLTPDQTTPDIFIPHRAGEPDLTGARGAKGVPRASRTIGDYTPSRIPLFARNNLGLLRSGLIRDDPKLLIEHVNRVIALQKANQLREFLLEKGTPLMPGHMPDFEHEYVIKTAGTNPNKALYDALESAESPGDVRGAVQSFIDDNIATSPTELAKLREGWTGDQQLYRIDKHTVDMLFRQVTGRRPGMTTRVPSTVERTFDTTLNALRGLLLYGNPGFYVANALGNFGMMMFNDPRSIKYLSSALKDAMKSSEIGVPHSKRYTTAGREVSPVFQRVSVEMGRGPTSGGLAVPPSILGREGGVVGRGAFRRGVEMADYRIGRLGHGAGAIVDDAFRVSAWRQEAAKLGYKTDKQVLSLLDDARRDTKGKRMGEADSKAIRDANAIRDKAEQLMLDFDSMTPFEKDYLARIIFLYPFLKASAKYPFMYAGEHPFTFGAAAQASNLGGQFASREDVLGPRPDLPEWAQGYARGPGGFFNVGSIDQMSVLADELQSAMGVGGPTPVGVNRPINYLHPGLQTVLDLMRSQNRYGRDANWGNILMTELPTPAYISSLYRSPSPLYSGSGFLDALKRSLRMYPFGVNEDYGSGG